jgi:hypothetical protein
MSPVSAPPTNVLRFRAARSPSALRLDQRGFMDAVYAAGSLPVAADDRTTKVMATRLTIFGFVVIDEVQADGSARRLRASEAFLASDARPWRVSKPSRRPESMPAGRPDNPAGLRLAHSL